MSEPSQSRLDVICVGGVVPGAIEALHQHFTLTITELDPVGGTFRWSDLAGPVNRAIDEAPGWVLLLRGGERVSQRLAAEIHRLVVDRPVAWAFRVPLAVSYAGGPLYRAPRRSTGEIRLFHSRRCRFLPKGETRELQSRGTVIRISLPIERELYPSVDAHLKALRAERVPHSMPRRLLLFLSRAWAEGGRLTLRSLRYHWIEAGWDRGGLSDESSADTM